MKPEKSDVDAETPLSKAQVKSLLTDIERWGSRHKIKLSSICNIKPDIYGEKSSTLRRKFQNKFDRLKKISDAEYTKIVMIHGVKQPVSAASTATDMTDSESETEGSIKPTKVEFKTPPMKVKTKPPLAGGSLKLESPAPSLLDAEDDEELADRLQWRPAIEIQMDFPERNREVYIFKFKDKVKDGQLFDGVQIVMPIQMPDAMLYSANTISSRSVEITMPGLQYLYYNGIEKFEKSLKKWGNGCEREEEGRGVAVNKYHEQRDRHVKKLLLKFPCKLDNTIFSEPDNNGNMTVDFVVNPTKYKYYDDDIAFQLHDTTIMWTIAIKEADSRVKKKVKKRTGLHKLYDRMKEDVEDDDDD